MPAVDTAPDRYYDGHTAQAHRVVVEIDDAALLIRQMADGHQLAIWPIAGMTVIDWNALNGEMSFRRSGSEGERLVLCPGPVRDALLAQAPHLLHWKRRERWRLGKAVTLLTLAALGLAAGCYFALPRLAVSLVQVMPLRWDKKLGDPIHDAVIQTLSRCKGEAGQTAIDSLGKRLIPPEISELPLTIDVVQMKQVNAFALPGNHIVVFSGLIDKAQAPEMLAGVLAHEMGHLDMRHPTRGLIEQFGLFVAVSFLAGNNSIGQLGQFMASMSYTRDMERQADERALALMQRAEIRSDGLARFFEILKKDESVHVPEFLSDHPGLQERVEATRQEADTGGPAMSPADWQAIKAMCGNP